MFYIVSAAAASGKSTMARLLKEELKDKNIICQDFDEPLESTSEKVYVMEDLIQDALKAQDAGKDYLVMAHCPFGELLASPSAIKLEAICGCLLDCHDYVRVPRYLDRQQFEEWPLDQHTLSWASWQRMHAIDPQWEQHVLLKGDKADLHWDRWINWASDDERWKKNIIDNSYKAKEETLELLVQWVKEEKNKKQLLTIESKWWEN